MTTLTKSLLMVPLACLAISSSDTPPAHSNQLALTQEVSTSKAQRPIRASGQASVQLRADKLSVNVSVAASADSIDGLIAALQQRRSEISSKAGSGDLSLISAEITSLRINKARRDGPEYSGTMQLAVIVAGIDDPLNAVRQISDEKVTRIDNLRYGYSEKLLKQIGLCETALSDARDKAAKQAQAAGRKLGKLLEHRCSNVELRPDYFSSDPERYISVSANASYEQVE